MNLDKSRGQHKGSQDYGSPFLRTTRYSLRRALSFDSVDSCTHNPKVGGSNHPPQPKLLRFLNPTKTPLQVVPCFILLIGGLSGICSLPLLVTNCLCSQRVAVQNRWRDLWGLRTTTLKSFFDLHRRSTTITGPGLRITS